MLRGVKDGKILVADPASYKRSGQPWELSIILNEASRRAGAGGPFWIIVLCLTTLPLVLFALIGISGESLSSFLVIFLKYMKNRRIVGGGESQETTRTAPGAGVRGINEFHAEEIKEIYHLRWGIETSFCTLKHTIAAVNFHAKSRQMIAHEIWARLILFFQFTKSVLQGCANIRE